MEKQTTGRISENGDCSMDVDLALDTNTTVGEFMAMVSTHRKKKKNQAKTAIREKRKKSFNPFSLQ
jgi:hypothetical protein